jgi:Zn ribbon nucleic-acid-binding protein
MIIEPGNIAINCPNCGSQWCPSEIDTQECLICGYPDPYDREINDEIND